MYFCAALNPDSVAASLVWLLWTDHELADPADRGNFVVITHPALAFCRRCRSDNRGVGGPSARPI